mgnify:CR=1 FL=1
MGAQELNAIDSHTSSANPMNNDNFSLGEKLGVGARIGGVVSTGRSAMRKGTMVVGKVELALPTGYRLNVESINGGKVPSCNAGAHTVNLCDLEGFFRA